MKRILVVDAQGGGLGKQIIGMLVQMKLDIEIIGVGTNAQASASMLKAGANQVATGENAAVVCSRNADIIIGPLGIVIADSMLGEITPRMAAAIGQSSAKRILIPMNQNCNCVVGLKDISIKEMVEQAIEEIKACC